MASHDQEFKLFLLHHAHELIASELGLQVEAWEPAENEPSPLPRERRLDRVFLARDQRLFIHYEVQHSTDPMMAHRMLEYGVRMMYSRRDLSEWYPVLSVILWPVRVGRIPDPPLRIPVVGNLEIIWPFVNIKIFEWTKGKLESSYPGILILAPLVPAVEVADLETYAQRLYTITEGVERAQAGVLFFTFVEERYRKLTQWPAIKAQVAQMLRKVGYGMDIIDQMILETDVAQDAITAAKQQAMAEGEAKGILQAKADAIHALWEHRFGPMTEAEITALHQQDIATLDHLFATFLAPTSTIEQARVVLGL